MHSDEKIALTKDMAMRLFGSTDILGQKVNLRGSSQTVCAILDGLEDHSNLSFGFGQKVLILVVGPKTGRIQAS